jgi:translin
VDRAAELDAIGRRARATLEERHRAREVTISASRLAIQACAASIRATHRGEYATAEALAAEARDHVRAAHGALGEHAALRGGGPLPDAEKELAEAWITLALVRDEPLPTMAELGVEPAPYLNGMAEAASELRREVLDRLREADLARAEVLLAAMEDVYSALVTVDYPDAVTGGLRRTTDALRAVLERTRGDVTTTMVASRLQTTIEQARAAAAELGPVGQARDDQ